nr:uncharacterized protein LOC109167502 [Ipomoea batatas]GMD54443.1 uncharacterized protein LOC109167502 [Ipomoea batatas]GMD95045.1 uncharacterized protein LOC109167502 [Ipomoea batatas]GME06571.1 uncharacterized protein LOC109167502 [Ipomoea batatas]GME14246.1 uncharacterized protein LOC109167502 [Ipomoea batatas]
MSKVREASKRLITDPPVSGFIGIHYQLICCGFCVPIQHHFSLILYAFDGYQYIWERSKGTPLWVEAKLDRILVSDSWCAQFNSAKACSVTTPKSDHMLFHLQILQPPVPNPKIRHRFENLWLREAHCREIMLDTWSKSQSQNLMDRVGRCGKAIWIWGKEFTRNFQRRLDH